jgi:hypothetical protein
MERIFFSKMLVSINEFTWYHNPEHHQILHHSENLKFHKLFMLFEPQSLYDVILKDTVIAGKNEKKNDSLCYRIVLQPPPHVTHSARTLHIAVY